MVRESLNVLQIASCDRGGGAENVAWSLFKEYRIRGYASWLGVGEKLTTDTDVFEIERLGEQRLWKQFWTKMFKCLTPLVGFVPGFGRLKKAGRRLVARPRAIRDWWSGYEDFNFPETWNILSLPPRLPSILHCHNLHDAYFDLRALPWLTSQVPTLLTLHDAWLLSGHCAHSLDCGRWMVGCGRCPHLALYPGIIRDGSEFNWKRKKQILSRSRVFIASPCKWLLKKVQNSILQPAIIEERVIPNGIDLDVFRPGDKVAARAKLGLCDKAFILIFVANGIRHNLYKDYATLRQTIEILSSSKPQREILLLGVGDRGPKVTVGNCSIKFYGKRATAGEIALFYQAGDLYVHAAKEDTFPTTVLEAMACGLPVVATAVGGIPEQVCGLNIGAAEEGGGGRRFDGATGVLVRPGDAEGMAHGISLLMTNRELLKQLSKKGLETARMRFDLRTQVSAYLEFYEDMLASTARKTRRCD